MDRGKDGHVGEGGVEAFARYRGKVQAPAAHPPPLRGYAGGPYRAGEGEDGRADAAGERAAAAAVVDDFSASAAAAAAEVG